jgi:hypothetical protein
MSDFRSLTSEERALIERLLEYPFAGRDEIRQQLEVAEVRLIPSCIDHGCGSLEFRLQNSVALIPESNNYDTLVPFEAWYSDGSGTVGILLFHRNGKLSELEFVVSTDEPRGELPDPSALTVFGPEA